MVYNFNLDYEIALAKNDFSFKDPKLNQELEYLFFFVEPHNTLFSQKKYSCEYLEFLKSKFNLIPKLTNDFNKSLISWWGEAKNLETERNLNSKILMYLEAKKKFSDYIIDCEIISEQDCNFNQNIVYRSEFGFSGKRLSSKGLISEKLERIEDFSVLNINGKIILYENLVNNSGSYFGTLIRSNTNFTLLSQFGLANELILEFENFYNEFSQYLINKFSLNDYVFSLDAFTYINKKLNKKNIYPFCEINYRKTMGYICYKIKELYFPLNEIVLIMDQKERLEIEPKLLEFINNRKYQILKISPKENRFKIYLLII